MAASRSTELGERLRAFHKKHGRNIGISAMAEFVVDSVNAAVAESNSKDRKLRAELGQLADYITAARSDLAALRPDEVKSELLPTASDELDAIVLATESATHEIMSATEAIDELAAAADEPLGERLGDQTMRIYQACGFQDITGQRITKVVQTLQHIDLKIDALIGAFEGVPRDQGTANTDKAKGPLTDEDLLNGPQAEGQAINQDDVDALLASFD